MLKIRLQRVGRRNDPAFRVIVIDHREGPKSGKMVEQIGHYNPKTKERKIDAERAKYWLSVGAQASGTVHNMLVSEKIIDAKKVNVLPQKSPVKKEEEPSETPEQAPVEASSDTEESASEETETTEAEETSKDEAEQTEETDEESSEPEAEKAA